MQENRYENKRVKELIEAAMKIIAEKGYDKTSVNDIISEVGIAKGTFYHYFKSKAELLNDIINFMWHDVLEYTDDFINDEEVAALDKFNRLLDISIEVKLKNVGFFIKIGQFLLQDENILIYEKMKDKSYEFSMKYFAKILKEGVEKGEFILENPEFAAEHIYMIFSYYGDKKKILSDIEYQMSLIKNKQKTIEKILGVPEGSINLYEKWVETLNKNQRVSLNKGV